MSKLDPFRAFIVFIIFIFIFPGCAMAENDLINDVFAFQKPDRFKSVDISSIVSKYIPIGMRKEAAVSKLKEQGLNVREEVDLKFNQCVDCEKLVILAGYIKKNVIPFLPDESYISVRLEFKEDRVAYVSGSHTKNVY